MSFLAKDRQDYINCLRRELRKAFEQQRTLSDDTKRKGKTNAVPEGKERVLSPKYLCLYFLSHIKELPKKVCATEIMHV